jgi:hypothetical protein
MKRALAFGSVGLVALLGFAGLFPVQVACACDPPIYWVAGVAKVEVPHAPMDLSPHELQAGLERELVGKAVQVDNAPYLMGPYCKRISSRIDCAVPVESTILGGIRGFRVIHSVRNERFESVEVRRGRWRGDGLAADENR